MPCQRPPKNITNHNTCMDNEPPRQQSIVTLHSSESVIPARFSRKKEKRGAPGCLLRFLERGVCFRRSRHGSIRKLVLAVWCEADSSRWTKYFMALVVLQRLSYRDVLTPLT